MRTDESLVSICVITYNHEAYIKQALDSILSQQTDFEFEVIIGEDFSSDKTREICAEYAASFPQRIKLLPSDKNRGAMLNLIETLKQASGKYIAFCEGDDYWVDDHKLKKQVTFLNAHPQCSMVFTDRYLLNEDGQVKDKDYIKNSYTIKDVVEGFIPGSQTIAFRNYGSLSDFLYNHLDAYSGDRYIAYFCSLCGSICKLEDITAVYRITGNGVWSTHNATEKVNRYNQLLQSFHASLGIPVNNEILFGTAFNSLMISLSSCIKNPKLLLNKTHTQNISRTWKLFNKMNRSKYLFKAVMARLRPSASVQK